MTIDHFVRAYGAIFEDSPWVAARAWERGPFASTDALHAAMVEEVERATPAEQLAILRAHPDLGGRGQMTTASAGEQSAAGLDALSPDEFARIADLNTAYRTKFGFPFILAVKGANSRDIIAALERRFPNSPDEEFREALREVYRIARFRLEST